MPVKFGPMPSKGLFVIKDGNKDNHYYGFSFKSKMSAKKKRDELNADDESGSKNWHITLGPDHWRSS